MSSNDDDLDRNRVGGDVRGQRNSSVGAVFAGIAVAAATLIGASSTASALSGSGLTDAVLDLNKELRCLALNIYHEARGEPNRGKLAVGHVVMNRVTSARYPNTICGVVEQGIEDRLFKCQFTWWCDRMSNRPNEPTAWAESKKLAFQVYTGMMKDPTGGALWYHADYVAPIWRIDLKRSNKIGQHVFYVLNKKSRAEWAKPKVGLDIIAPVQTGELREILTVDPTQ